MQQQRTINGKQAMLAALKQSLGIVSDACKVVDISRETFYQWKNNDAQFAAAVESIEYDALDFAKSMLYKRMAGMTIKREGPNGITTIELPPDVDAIKFFLIHKGQKIGFGLKNQLPAKEEKQKPVAPVFILRPQGERPEIIKYGEDGK